MLVMGIIIAVVAPLVLWLVSKIPLSLLKKTKKRYQVRLKENKEKMVKLQSERDHLNLERGELIDTSVIDKTIEQLINQEGRLFSDRLKLKVASMTITFVIWVIRFINLIFVVLGSSLIPVFVAGIVSALVIIVMMTGGGGTPIDGNNSGSNRSGVSGCSDYLNMDWSQDFSKQLSEIESKYNREVRNWVYLTIIGMNTATQELKKGNIKYTIPGIYTGIKAVESEQKTWLDEKTGDPINDMTNVDGVGNGGPFQFDTNWMVLNPYYPDKFKSERGSGGHAQYYPDTAMGVFTNYQKFFEGGRTWGAEHKNVNLKSASEVLGVTFSEEETNFMMYLNMLSVEYNGIYLMDFGLGLSRQDAADAATANAIVAYLFYKDFGNGVTDKTIEYVKELGKDITNNYNLHYLPKYEIVPKVYGMPSSGLWHGYPNELDKNSWFYKAVSSKEQKVQDFIFKNNGYPKFLVSESHHWRPKYDLTSLVTGAYDIWWAADKLELCTPKDDGVSVGSGKVGEALVELAKKHAKNLVITYSHAGKELLHDCSSYVNGLLRELGYLLDGSKTEKIPLDSSTAVGGSFRSTASMMRLVKEKPKLLVDIEGHKYSETNKISKEDFEKYAKPGDILLVNNNSHQHTAIYVGKNSSGEHIMAEALCPGCSYGYSNMDLTGTSMEAGLTRLNYEGNDLKYTHLIRIDQVIE